MKDNEVWVLVELPPNGKTVGIYGGDLKRELRVSCYTDAGYLTDANDLKSQTGYVFVLNGGVVDWKSAKQSILVTSSTEAEYIATFDASKEAIWVRKFIFGLSVVPTIEEPISMYCDNTGAIAIANESRITKASRIKDVGMTQAGSRVACLFSSRIGFNHSGLYLNFGRWAESVSSESDILAVFGIEAPVSCRLHLLRSKSGRGGGGFSHLVVSCETCPFQSRVRPWRWKGCCCSFVWTVEELRKMLNKLNSRGRDLGILPRIHNIHQRSTSPFHLAEEDLRLDNLKFVPKGEVEEVFGMLIPNEQILNNIKNAPYYNAYLEMVVKHDRKVTAEKEGKMKTVSAKQPKSKPAIEKSSKPTPAPKPKATKERPSNASTAKPPKPKLAKEKSTKTTPPQKSRQG
nr:retrovirus-related Pol polyprotein from transposon TNT 1-94 [Tanacetum cinerariifolium]